MIRHALAVSYRPDLIWKGGRTCELCIDRFLKNHPEVSYEEMAWFTTHPQAHSASIGHCVDELLLPFLEGFNRRVAPTFASCQGPEDCYVAIDVEHNGSVQGWLRCSGNRYEIGKVEVHLPPLNSARIAFSATPTSWKG